MRSPASSMRACVTLLFAFACGILLRLMFPDLSDSLLAFFGLTP